MYFQFIKRRNIKKTINLLGEIKWVPTTAQDVRYTV